MTATEAKTIAAFDEDFQATVPELAVATRLTPDEVRIVVQQLAVKQLVVLQDQFSRLTEAGVTVRRRLDQRRQGKHGPEVLVLPDELYQASAEIDAMSDEQLDALIEGELLR